MIEVFINTTPKPAPRPKFANKHAYMPTDYQEYLNDIKKQLQFNLPAFQSADIISLQITFYKNKPIHSRAFGDIDNLIKGVMDAMNGIVYKDDSQVTTIAASKLKAAQEGIKISIMYLGAGIDNSE